MKKLALALIAATAAFAGQAIAADMPMKAARPVAAPVPVANWTGCYIGGGGGYGLFDQENTPYFNGPPRVLAAATYDSGGRGWFGTVQGGCDYQFAGPFGNWVIGAFADYDFADIKGQFLTGFNGNGIGTDKISSQWAVGGRIGWVALPQLLTYVSGGYTEATFDQINYTSLIPPLGIPTGISLDKRVRTGWFLGAGDEYALSFLPGLFWKTEYRLSRFDNQTAFERFTATGLLSGGQYDQKTWVHTVRSELVWRFNWGGPVVAKY